MEAIEAMSDGSMADPPANKKENSWNMMSCKKFGDWAEQYAGCCLIWLSHLKKYEEPRQAYLPPETRFTFKIVDQSWYGF
jgi:hypothetical protein